MRFNLIKLNTEKNLTKFEIRNIMCASDTEQQMVSDFEKG